MKKIPITIVMGLLFFLTIFSGCIERDISGESKGSLYVNDCGEPKGGWEYTGEYFANLTLSKGIGKLTLEMKPGLGDYMTKHTYLVVLTSYTSEEMQLFIDGKKAILEWVENDEIWDHTWDNHYIARFGINMEENEIIGKIKPDYFSGLKSHFYVELRLPEIT